MIRRIGSRLREWIAVEDPDERIEGSGDAILSPQHRRSPRAQQELERLDQLESVETPSEMSSREPDTE